MIPIAGFFQIFDGFQAVSAGILRGVGDTRVPMLVAVIGFWVVGMPVSLYLGYPAGFGPVGLWWGFVAGLGCSRRRLSKSSEKRVDRGVGTLAVGHVAAVVYF